MACRLCSALFEDRIQSDWCLLSWPTMKALRYNSRFAGLVIGSAVGAVPNTGLIL